MRRPDWDGRIEQYLDQRMPPQGDHENLWDLIGLGARELAGQALVALGRGEIRGYQPGRLRTIRKPAQPARWDDLCLAAITMAYEYSQIEFVEQGKVVDWLDRQANIVSVRNLPSAHAEPTELQLLKDVGLVEGDAWSDVAEQVLWRYAMQWPRKLSEEPQVVAAVTAAVAECPEYVRQNLAALMEPTNQRQLFDIYQLVRNRWRLVDGWLSDTEAHMAFGENGVLDGVLIWHLLENQFPNSPLFNYFDESLKLHSNQRWPVPPD